MKEIYIKIFTENITYLRKAHKLTLKQMSEILCISIYSIRQLEKGVLPSKLKANVLFNIQKHFNISPQIMVGEILNPPANSD